MTHNVSNTERQMCIYRAKAYLNEARLRRRHRGGFYFTLLRWAANARREAIAMTTSPVQGNLF